MAGILDSPLFQPPLVYFVFFAMVLVVAVIIFLKFFKPKKTEDHFKGETIEEVLNKKNFDKYFDTFGRKLKKGLLYWNQGKIKIQKVVILRTTITPLKVNPHETKKESKQEEREFICFSKGGFLSKIPLLNRLSPKTYFIIDNLSRFIHKDKYNDWWVIEQDVHLHLFGGIWISSTIGTAFLTDMIYKRVYEHVREEEMNYPARMVWLNDKYANEKTNKQLDAEIEDNKWKSKQANESAR